MKTRPQAANLSLAFKITLGEVQTVQDYLCFCLAQGTPYLLNEYTVHRAQLVNTLNQLNRYVATNDDRYEYFLIGSQIYYNDAMKLFLYDTKTKSKNAISPRLLYQESLACLASANDFLNEAKPYLPDNIEIKQIFDTVLSSVAQRIQEVQKFLTIAPAPENTSKADEKQITTTVDLVESEFTSSYKKLLTAFVQEEPQSIIKQVVLSTDDIPETSDIVDKFQENFNQAKIRYQQQIMAQETQLPNTPAPPTIVNNVAVTINIVQVTTQTPKTSLLNTDDPVYDPDELDKDRSSRNFFSKKTPPPPISRPLQDSNGIKQQAH